MAVDKHKIDQLIRGMRKTYAAGGNAMECARSLLEEGTNTPLATLIAYDLQAGTYIDYAEKNPEHTKMWCDQISDIICPYIGTGDSILEVGSGEATTLAGVIERLGPGLTALGFDLSWSRCVYGAQWLGKNNIDAQLFVGDLFNIPLADNSVDIVYTSHSLEPNGGKESDAIKECLRVARRLVILVEPIYELASSAAKDRMERHGYVRGLGDVAEELGATVEEFRLLNYCINPLNPSGLVLISKVANGEAIKTKVQWQCPLTTTALEKRAAAYYSELAGVAYPILSGIPMLRTEHAIIASAGKYI